MNAVCITTFNEVDTIGKLVYVLAPTVKVYVVDDGSTDGTAEEAQRYGATVIQTGGGKGIGPSLELGWRQALTDGADRIIQMDAGASHDPFAFLGMLAHMEATNADLVIGSRFVAGSSYVLPRAVVAAKWSVILRPTLSRIAALMCNLARGTKIHDWTSGYRIFDRRCAEYLLDRYYVSTMHGWQLETLAHAEAGGFRIVEAPIFYTAGRSSFNGKIAHEAVQSWFHILHHIHRKSVYV